MSISSVQDYSVGHYFNPDDKLRFFIPKYQREYVWNQTHWDALFNDLEDSPEGHFLGSIICVNNQADAMAGSRLELIDGQQRFTTISLLFCALYAKLSQEPSPDDDLRFELMNLRKRLFVSSLKDQWRFEPSEQASNKADFQKVLGDLFPKIVAVPKNLARFGNRRIAKAYRYFGYRLESFDLRNTLGILNKLKSAILVKIEVPSHSDAFVLFETINNRGIPLSAIDIIKNNLLAELDKRENYGIDRAFDEWKELVDRLPDPNVQERLLRQIYNVFKYLPSVEVKGHPRATRSNLLAIYDALLRRRPVVFFRHLQAKGKTYSTLLDPTAAEIEWGKVTAAALQDLQRLGAAPAYAFLLWASQVAKSQKWSESEVLADLAGLLTKWFFWRNLTDTPATRDLDRIFTDLVGELLALIQKGELADASTFVAQAKSSLQKHVAPEDLCVQHLNGDLYEDNYDVTRFLLCKLEESHQTRENRRNLWEYVKDRPVFTVEHIMPKSESMKQGWIKMLADGDTDKADEIRKRCAHKLGNLTLSGYNSDLGKMEFERKRDRVNDKGDSIGYKNGFYLNTDLAKRDDWNESSINDRTEKLIEEIKSRLGLWEQPS